MQCFRQMNIILSVGLKGNAAKLHRWFSRSNKKLIEMGFFLLFFFFISSVPRCHRALGVWIKKDF